MLLIFIYTYCILRQSQNFKEEDSLLEEKLVNILYLILFRKPD